MFRRRAAFTAFWTGMLQRLQAELLRDEGRLWLRFVCCVVCVVCLCAFVCVCACVCVVCACVCVCVRVCVRCLCLCLCVIQSDAAYHSVTIQSTTHSSLHIHLFHHLHPTPHSSHLFHHSQRFHLRCLTHVQAADACAAGRRVRKSNGCADGRFAGRAVSRAGSVGTGTAVHP